MELLAGPFPPTWLKKLLTKFESPESGNRLHKLVNIRTHDPDPLLFQVPADYTVKETPQQ